MEFSKKKLVSIMEEVKSIESDVDEMALRRAGLKARTIDKTTGQVKIPRIYEVWRDDNPTPIGGTGSPDAFLLNNTQQPGDQILIVPLGCSQEGEFIEQNREWLDSIGALYDVEKDKFTFCSGKYDYIPNKYRKPVSGEKASIETKNKTLFLNIMRREFDKDTDKGSAFTDLLKNKLSIPGIVINTKHMSAYRVSFTNEKIEFTTHSYNNYNTAQEFLQTVIKRIAGREVPQVKDEYLVRQDNPIYRNYPEDRPAVAVDKGETPIYKLRTQGYTEGNKDVSLLMRFNVKGEKIGDSWVWTISMTNKFGRKPPGAMSIGKGLETYTLSGGEDELYGDKNFYVTKEVPYPNKDLTDQSIMSDISVVSSLDEAINDFKNIFEKIEPKSVLTLANVSRKELTNKGRNINETVNSIIKKIKKIDNGKSSKT